MRAVPWRGLARGRSLLVKDAPLEEANALVLMLPNENRERQVLLSYGIYTQGSQAAIELMTNPDRLEELRRALLAASPDGKTLADYFQALIEAAVENGAPGPSSLVAVRLVPEEGPWRDWCGRSEAPPAQHLCLVFLPGGPVLLRSRENERPGRAVRSADSGFDRAARQTSGLEP